MLAIPATFVWPCFFDPINMNSITRYENTGLLLNELEQTLKTLRLWRDTPLNESAFQSTLPFCCDTMSLEQWLQFVLLPKMRQLIEARLPLPTRMAILPYAEETLRSQGDHIAPLLRVIAALDQHIHASQGAHAD